MHHGIFSLAFGVIILIPLWRIFQRAGLAPALALLALIPVFGAMVVVLILAIARWSPSGERYAGGYQPDLFEDHRR